MDLKQIRRITLKRIKQTTPWIRNWNKNSFISIGDVKEVHFIEQILKNENYLINPSIDKNLPSITKQKRVIWSKKNPKSIHVPERTTPSISWEHTHRKRNEKVHQVFRVLKRIKQKKTHLIVLCDWICFSRLPWNRIITISRPNPSYIDLHWTLIPTVQKTVTSQIHALNLRKR